MGQKIECPKCGHKGSYQVEIWGGGTVTEDGSVEADTANISEHDYAQCPSCGYETYDHDDFKRGGL